MVWTICSCAHGWTLWPCLVYRPCAYAFYMVLSGLQALGVWLLYGPDRRCGYCEYMALIDVMAPTSIWTSWTLRLRDLRAPNLPCEVLEVRPAGGGAAAAVARAREALLRVMLVVGVARGDRADGGDAVPPLERLDLHYSARHVAVQDALHSAVQSGSNSG